MSKRLCVRIPPYTGWMEASRKHHKNSMNLYNKIVCPIKNDPQQGISYLETEREGVRDREGWEGVRKRESGQSRSAGTHI